LNPDHTPLSIEKAKIFIKDAFLGATERDIYTGDFLEMFIITKEGVQVEKSELKKD
jgi:20S proteasome subunit beta 6